MKHRKQIQIEWILITMFVIQGITIFYPNILPQGFSNYLLLIILVSYTLYKIHFLDMALKKKIHEGGM